MVNPSPGSLIVRSFTEAPVEAPIIGALVTSGIVASSELVGTPLSQLPAVAQSVSVAPVQVVEELATVYVEKLNVILVLFQSQLVLFVIAESIVDLDPEITLSSYTELSYSSPAPLPEPTATALTPFVSEEGNAELVDAVASACQVLLFI